MSNGVGTRIKQRRMEKGMSLRELARQSNLTAGFICDLEHGKRSVSIHNAARIAEALGWAPADLLGEEPPRLSSIRQLSQSARELTNWLDWERESLAKFHAYAHKFGCAAGGNVYLFVLRDALAHRGTTPALFEAEVSQ